MVGASHSSEARGAMQSIREIYVSQGDADAYFDYAAKAGLESDLTALSRDSLSFAAAQKTCSTDSRRLPRSRCAAMCRAIRRGIT